MEWSPLVRKVKSFSLVPETNFHMPQPINHNRSFFYTPKQGGEQKKKHLETKHFGILTIRQVGVSNHAPGKQCFTGHQILLPSIRMVDEFFCHMGEEKSTKFLPTINKNKTSTHVNVRG